MEVWILVGIVAVVILACSKGESSVEITDDDVENQEYSMLEYAITEHYKTLKNKKDMLCYKDDYGRLRDEDWKKELTYFIKSVVFQNEEIEDYEMHKYLGIARDIMDELRFEKINLGDSLSEKNLLLPESYKNGYEFESVCKQLLTNLGYSAYTTSKSGDQGVDVIAKKEGKTIAIQCKLYSQPVGNKAVQEVAAGKVYYKADYAIVVTNHTYTKSAKQLAKNCDVHLLNIKELNTIDKLFGFKQHKKTKPKKTESSEIQTYIKPGELGEKLYQAAVWTVLHDRIPTAGHLSMALDISGRKAAELIERMVDDEIVSPQSSTGNRKILIQDIVELELKKKAEQETTEEENTQQSDYLNTCFQEKLEWLKDVVLGSRLSAEKKKFMIIVASILFIMTLFLLPNKHYSWIVFLWIIISFFEYFVFMGLTRFIYKAKKLHNKYKNHYKFIVLILVIGVILGIVGHNQYDRNFRVLNVNEKTEIEGNKITSNEQILKTLEIGEKDLHVADLEDKEKELEKLFWIEKANLVRISSNEIKIIVKEKIPTAYIKNEKDEFIVLDEMGNVVDDKKFLIEYPEYKSSLILINQPEITQECQKLLVALSTVPEIRSSVTSASFIEGKRWNVQLHAESELIKVLLPENNLEDALKRLSNANNKENLLEKDAIESIDLRFDGKIRIKLRENSLKETVIK